MNNILATSYSSLDLYISIIFFVMQVVLLISMFTIARRLWFDNILLLKGFSIRIHRGFRNLFQLSDRGCVLAVAEWVSRQKYNRDVWRVTLTYKDQERIITTSTLAFYYDKDRRTGKRQLDKEDLIKYIHSAIVDWGRGSRWKLICLDDDAPQEEPRSRKETKDYEIISDS